MKTVPENEREFFIGYDPPLPPRLGRFVARVVWVIGAGALMWSAVAASGHVPLEGGLFEYGHPDSFEGVIHEKPYPTLAVSGQERLLLVLPGKHGADAYVHGLEGRKVTLRGTRIMRNGHIMVEVEPGTLTADVAIDVPVGHLLEEGVVSTSIRLSGEIVDSKCFLGVMVPGSGKTHKECAALCLRGGIPPALYVRDRENRTALLLLTGPSGEALGQRAAPIVGEPIAMTGRLERQGNWFVLKTDPATWELLSR
ncbi:MAG: hypothetical protein AB7I50_16540 [Vicinamibacterales bacterium]